MYLVRFRQLLGGSASITHMHTKDLTRLLLGHKLRPLRTALFACAASTCRHRSGTVIKSEARKSVSAIRRSPPHRGRTEAYQRSLRSTTEWRDYHQINIQSGRLGKKQAIPRRVISGRCSLLFRPCLVELVRVSVSLSSIQGSSRRRRGSAEGGATPWLQ